MKQTLTTTSTMEAEFVSYFEASLHGVWLKSLISGLRIVDCISRPLKLYYDNSTLVFVAKNNKSESRSKHINIKYLFIRERVKEMEVAIDYMSTEPMITDPLTKGMPPKYFKDNVVQWVHNLIFNFIVHTFIILIELLSSMIFSHMILYISDYYYYFEKYH